MLASDEIVAALERYARMGAALARQIAPVRIGWYRASIRVASGHQGGQAWARSERLILLLLGRAHLMAELDLDHGCVRTRGEQQVRLVLGPQRLADDGVGDEPDEFRLGRWVTVAQELDEIGDVRFPRQETIQPSAPDPRRCVRCHRNSMAHPRSGGTLLSTGSPLCPTVSGARSIRASAPSTVRALRCISWRISRV